jgi:hypothetical protein
MLEIDPDPVQISYFKNPKNGNNCRFYYWGLPSLARMRTKDIG